MVLLGSIYMSDQQSRICINCLLPIPLMEFCGFAIQLSPLHAHSATKLPAKQAKSCTQNPWLFGQWIVTRKDPGENKEILERNYSLYTNKKFESSVRAFEIHPDLFFSDRHSYLQPCFDDKAAKLLCKFSPSCGVFPGNQLLTKSLRMCSGLEIELS